MVNVKILDTGYVSTTVSGRVQLSDANRAGYTGSAVSSFTLNVASISMGGSVGIENKPIVNTLTDNDTSLIGTVNRVFTFNCIIDKTSVTAVSWDVNNIHQFFRLDRTHGLKIVYVDATTDTKKTIIEALGAVNTGSSVFDEASPTDDKGTVSTTTPYLIGRVRNMRVTDDSTNTKWWRVSFDFEISG